MRLLTKNLYSFSNQANGQKTFGVLKSQSKMLLCFALMDKDGKEVGEMYGMRNDTGFTTNGVTYLIERPKAEPKTNALDALYNDSERGFLATLVSKSQQPRVSISFKSSDGTPMIAILRKSKSGPRAPKTDAQTVAKPTTPKPKKTAKPAK